MGNGQRKQSFVVPPLGGENAARPLKGGTTNARARFVAALTGIFVFCSCTLAFAAGPKKVNYEEDIKPILREHCCACHNQGKATNDLALDSYDRIRKGGASGDCVTAGDVDGSYLMKLVSHKDQPFMPPNAEKISDVKVELLRQWILGGLLKDSGSKAEVKKPSLNLAMKSGAKRPDGPAIMPEGVCRQPLVYTPRAAAISALAASPWAPLVALAGQRQVSLYNSDSLALAGVLPFSEGIPYSIRFSRSSQMVLVGGGKAASRGMAALYDVKTGKRLCQVGDELDAVLASDINASQTLIALGGPQKVVRVFNVSDGAQAAEIHKHTDWVTALEFSPDGVLMASGDRSGGVWVWEAGTNREFQDLGGHKGAITAMSWRDDSNILATASEDGTIIAWSMETGKKVKEIRAHDGGVTSLQYLHDGRLVSGGRDHKVKLWDTQGNHERDFEPMGDVVMKVAAAHDGARIFGGDWSGEVRVYQATDGKLLGKLAANPPTLEMKLAVVKAEEDKVRIVAEAAKREADEAQKTFDAKRRAAEEAAAALAKTSKAVQDLAAEKAAFDRNKTAEVKK
jgi:hypothetical protein